MDGIIVPKIILPKNSLDKNWMNKWAVVAVDQYTSEPEYWKKIDNLVGNNPSTLRIVLPEIYLEDKDVNSKILKINNTMEDYMKQGIFQEFEGFILVDRKTPFTNSRKGLIVALDLEHYDYTKGAKTLIRATEGTIVERLPPRIKIRKNAPIELPHIMVLIDDPKKTVIEPLFKEKLPVAYDFDLMMNSGHIKGYKINKDSTDKILIALKSLAKQFPKIYNDKNVLLFAMGDGNHSLASAKAMWEDIKKTIPKKEQENHPSRYALVELVNVHDDGLKFEPIHRVVFNADKKKMFDKMKQFYTQQGSSLTIDDEDYATALKKGQKKQHIISYVSNGKVGTLTINNPKQNLAVGTLQSFLDVYCAENNLKIDYIHGTDVVKKISKQKSINGENIGFLLPVMPKTELFRTVILDGALPRKTFSMGEASEKRFYIESRKIR